MRRDAERAKLDRAVRNAKSNDFKKLVKDMSEKGG